ncbi:hypothetical protein KIPB_012998, partial [Kipferlia bialata]
VSMVVSMVEMVRDEDYDLDTVCAVGFGCDASLSVAAPGSHTCSLCGNLVPQYEDLLDDGDSTHQIRNSLSQYCHEMDLPVYQTEVCLSMVLDMVHEATYEGYDLDSICEVMYGCDDI